MPKDKETKRAQKALKKAQKERLGAFRDALMRGLNSAPAIPAGPPGMARVVVARCDCGLPTCFAKTLFINGSVSGRFACDDATATAVGITVETLLFGTDEQKDSLNSALGKLGAEFMGIDPDVKPN